jgi:hypothetical protein
MTRLFMAYRHYGGGIVLSEKGTEEGVSVPFQRIDRFRSILGNRFGLG